MTNSIAHNECEVTSLLLVRLHHSAVTAGNSK